MKYSIIIAVYNRLEEVKELLESAEKLEQAISELRGRGEQMELTDPEEKPTGE